MDDLVTTLKQQTAAQIQIAMKRHGIKKAWLARSLNVSRANVTQMLSADTNLTLESIAIIARAIGHVPEIRLIDPTSARRDPIGRIKAALLELGDCNVLQPEFSVRWQELKSAVMDAERPR